MRNRKKEVKKDLNLTVGPQLSSSLLCSPYMGHRQKPWVDHRLVGFCVNCHFEKCPLVFIWGQEYLVGCNQSPANPGETDIWLQLGCLAE